VRGPGARGRGKRPPNGEVVGLQTATNESTAETSLHRARAPWPALRPRCATTWPARQSAKVMRDRAHSATTMARRTPRRLYKKDEQCRRLPTPRGSPGPRGGGGGRRGEGGGGGRDEQKETRAREGLQGSVHARKSNPRRPWNKWDGHRPKN